jgi:hypothetical protein
MEWASRVTVGQTVARSLDRRIGKPRTASKHPRGDHPSPTGSCDPGSTWANTLKKHAWSLAPDVPGTAPALVGAASRIGFRTDPSGSRVKGDRPATTPRREPRLPRSAATNP